MNGPMRRLARAYRYDLPLRRKLLIANIAVIAVPLAILALFASDRVSRITEQRAAFSAEQSLEQAASFLGYMMYNVTKASELIFVSQDVTTILSADHRSYPIGEQLRDMNDLRNFLFSFQDGVNIDRVRLYVPSGSVYSSENINLFDLSAAERTRWYAALVESGRPTLWCPSEYLTSDPDGGGNDRLSFARYMVDPNDLRRNVGLLRIDFKKEWVGRILQKADTIRGSVTFVLGPSGELVAASDDGAAGALAAFAGSFSSLQADGLLRQTQVGGHQEMVGIRPLPGSDWRMVTMIPLGAMSAESKNVRNGIFLVMLAAVIIGVGASYLISGSVTRRISALMARMRGSSPGNLEKLGPVAGRDEIGELMTTYNAMTDRIRVLIEEESQARQEIKGAELKALQAQINPHFLYNTLDMINWLTQQGSAAEVDSVIKWLANFYRLSLSSGRTMIPLRDEIEHVTLYYRIQNMRFLGSLQLVTEIDESLLDYRIVKTTLQPLVENAILHGIRERSDKAGSILISGRIDGNDLVLAVSDDGVGIAPERLATLLDAGAGPTRGRTDAAGSGMAGVGGAVTGSGVAGAVESNATAAGPGAAADLGAFGVRNIHERIRLQYGAEYGLSFASEIGRGTVVTVRIRAEHA